jgi:hypothetical protein
MPDVTVKSIDDMEEIYGRLARRARAELGVTAWGMQAPSPRRRVASRRQWTSRRSRS